MYTQIYTVASITLYMTKMSYILKNGQAKPKILNFFATFRG